MKFKNTTIRQLHEALKKGTIQTQDLYRQAMEVIDQQEETINAFVEVFNNDKITQASFNTLLSGIPVAVKDNILFQGKKVSASSRILENYTASYDSKIAEILKNNEAIIIGRTNMDEFAMGSSTENSALGSTRNPLDESRVPGGSSGGSAAAVCAGMAMYALGSDTGGSIRQPASYCGLVGLKPTYGSVSRRGLIALASSLDVIGPITRCVDDAEVVFDIISEYDVLDSTSVPIQTRTSYQDKNTNNKTIGVPQSFLKMDGIDDEVLENFNINLEKMKDLGYKIINIDLPTIKYSLAVYYILQPAEASSNLARFDGIRYGLSSPGEDLLSVYTKTKTNGFGKEVKRRIMLGTYVLSSGYHDEYYYKARSLRNRITEEVYNIFDFVDIIATPTTPSVAFHFDKKKDPVSMYLEDIFTVPYNLTGNPAISIPSGNNSEGMPFGIHFTAPMFCEKKLFEVAKDFENLVV